MDTRPHRCLVAWAPDWPVTAVGGQMDAPVAVVDAEGARAVVVACSAAAREAGVRRGQRVRDAQRLLPGLAVHVRDEAAEARAFEPVAVAAEGLAAGVEIVRPGLLALDARGPARYHGGEEELARLFRDAIGELTTASGDNIGVGVGCADGTFAALHAARRDLIVEAGDSAAFLAPLPLAVLEQPQLERTLDTLGVRTLGAFAALPPTSVAGRFGTVGIEAHRLARGLDPRPPAPRRPAEDFTVSHEFEEPAETDEQVVFVAKMLAGRLYATLGDNGLACTRVGIEAETASGRVCARWWRLGDVAVGRLAPVQVARRAAWQIDGWRAREAVGERADPVVRLRLIPDQLVIDTGAQQALWGAEQVPDRVNQAIDRVEGLLGHGGVARAQIVGGRDPASMVRYVPWGDPAEPATGVEAPWPGAVPPHPPLVPTEPVDAQLLDTAGHTVVVSGRATLSGAPALLLVGGQRLQVSGYAGPWPYVEAWWDAQRARRCARIQVATVDGRAWLLVVEGGRWRVEGVYG